jgi:hypothetical protein
MEVRLDDSFRDHELHDWLERPCPGGQGLLKNEVPAGFELEIAHFDRKSHQLLCLLQVPWSEWTLVRNGEKSARWRHRQHEWSISFDHLTNLVLIPLVSKIVRPVSYGILEVLIDGPPTFQIVGLRLYAHSRSGKDFANVIFARISVFRNRTGSPGE